MDKHVEMLVVPPLASCWVSRNAGILKFGLGFKNYFSTSCLTQHVNFYVFLFQKVRFLCSFRLLVKLFLGTYCYFRGTMQCTHVSVLDCTL